MTLHQIRRIRHESRRRTLTVALIEQLTPSMIRFRFSSPDLGDFSSMSADDHVKLLFPEPSASADERPPMRDFTPRSFDRDKGVLVIDFAVHDTGPAMRWAKNARVGDTLQIGGPRGSAVIPDDFDWYVLIGDETAFPSIARRVEELRAGVHVETFVIMADDASGLTCATQAAWIPHWLARAGRSDFALLKQALSGLAFPPGDGFVWIAAEASVARSVKTYIVEDRGHPREWVKAAGYWAKGEADSHVKIED